MDNDTVIRVRDAAELLAFISYQLGFTQQQSVASLDIRSEGSTGMAARADLAAFADPAAAADIADVIAGHLLDDGARDLMGIVYSNVPHTELATHPDITTLLPFLCARTGWPQIGWWHVGPETFTSIDVNRGPGEPRALSEVATTRVAASMVLAGRSLVASREELGKLPEVDAEARAMARQTARCAQEQERIAGMGRDAAWLAEHAERWSRLLDAVRANSPLPPPELGRLAVGLSDRRFRDQIISATCMGVPDHLGAPGWRDVAAAVLRPNGPAPESAVLATVEEVLTAVAAHLEDAQGIDALVMLGWFAWWRGHHAKADVLISRCLATNSQPRLASLMRDVPARGVPPGWVKSREDTGGGRR